MAYYRSRIAKNTAREFLDRSGLTTDLCAGLVGLDPALVQAFVDDPRLMPDLAMAMKFVLGTGSDAANLLAVDPLPAAVQAAAATPLPVVIYGAGNLGHVFTALLGARPDIEVRLLLSSEARVQEFRQQLATGDGVRVQLPDGSVISGKPALVTADPMLAIPGARIILLCIPSHLEVAALDRILPCLDNPDVCIGSIPAPGGFDWKARAALLRHDKQALIFGMGYIPWMCKMTAFGREARILGGKPVNVLSVLPAARTGEVADLLTRILQTPVLDLGSFLNMTLHPGNQVLHPAITYSMFKDWDGSPLPEPPLFYEGCTAEAAGLCQRLSDEIQLLKQTLEQMIPGLSLPLVLPLQLSLIHGYGAAIADPRTLHSCITSNRAYAGIRTPMMKVAAGWLPDWSSRFFWEDIPHGLVVLRGLADLLQLSLPLLDEILLWSQHKMQREFLVDGSLNGKDISATGAPQCYGIHALADLMRNEAL